MYRHFSFEEWQSQFKNAIQEKNIEYFKQVIYIRPHQDPLHRMIDAPWIIKEIDNFEQEQQSIDVLWKIELSKMLLDKSVLKDSNTSILRSVFSSLYALSLKSNLWPVSSFKEAFDIRHAFTGLEQILNQSILNRKDSIEAWGEKGLAFGFGWTNHPEQ